MSILDRIAQGPVVADPYGQYQQTKLQGQQFQQQQQLSQVRGALMTAQYAQIMGGIQTQEQAKQAIDQQAQAWLPAVESLGLPPEQAEALRNQLQGNATTKAAALGVIQKSAGAEKFATTAVPALIGGQSGFVQFGDRGTTRQVGAGASPVPKGPLVNIVNSENELAKGDIKQVNTEGRQRFNAANDGLRKVAQMRTVLDTAKTGDLAAWQTKSGKLAQFFNIDPTAFGITAEQVASNEQISRLQFGLAEQIFAQQKGAISDKEFKAIMAGAPGVDNTEAGNRLMLDLMEQSMRFNRDMALAQRKYLTQNKSLDGWWEREADLVDMFIAEQTAPAGAQ